ncbi:RNA recognition motif domain-containing protein [Mucisphaera calidilacus]|uniref:RNA recognition motif (RRM, RBD, or RNP domain) n=1 Tax=Mucisphaera calidilacus TaxID=2527982 RepID=A0A518BZY6_9BACT|nr:RNA-binding protein [Mucisphaera calidilacus]QDU72538.1 RNA recognition motif (RRM, RBD, or RNP domain) [Mucisphaera calidilacus]
MNIYVGNLPYDTTEQELVDLFSTHGKVDRATLVFDRETGRPRGFAFVEMPDDVEGRKAIEALAGQPFNNRPLTINEARPRTPGATQRQSELRDDLAPASSGYSGGGDQESTEGFTSRGYTNTVLSRRRDAAEAEEKPVVDSEPQPDEDASSQGYHGVVDEDEA